MVLNFQLNIKLESDSHYVADLELSQARLINNSDYNWLILIPRKSNVVEITDLTEAEYSLLCNEIRLVSQVMQKLFKPHKLNIATIGNIVRQLHVHIIARFNEDKLFPKPVWGCEFTPYTSSELEQKISLIREALKNHVIKS